MMIRHTDPYSVYKITTISAEFPEKDRNRISQQSLRYGRRSDCKGSRCLLHRSVS